MDFYFTTVHFLNIYFIHLNMKKVLLLLLCAQIYQCILVQYESGTIIKQTNILNAGSTTMHLIVQIPKLIRQPSFTYPPPCSYIDNLHSDLHHLQSELHHIGIANAMPKILKEFTSLCNKFTTFKELLSHLQKSYVRKIERSIHELDLLSGNKSARLYNPGARRHTRGIFSAIRHMFGIADYSRQKQLQSDIRKLDDNQFTMQGDLINMKFIIAHQDMRLLQLQKSVVKINSVLQSVQEFTNDLVQTLNARKVSEHYEENMLFDLVNAGILANEVLQNYAKTVHGRVKAFALLNRHYLSPTLLSPLDLQDILDKLVKHVSNEHPFLSLFYDNIYTYYGLQNINFYSEDNNLYLQIPVLLKLHHQEFKLFSLTALDLPMPNQRSHLMRAVHSSYIAVNIDAETFVTLNDDWKVKLQCDGFTNIYCSNIFSETYMENSRSCELAIVRNITEDIANNCEYAVFNRKTATLKFHIIADNRLLIENPREADIYQRCQENEHELYLTNATLAEIAIPCFCYLYGAEFSTSIITSDNCIVTPNVTLYNPTNNIIFMKLLNISYDNDNISMDLIPELQMPNLIEDFTLDDDKHMLNLKDVLLALKNDYYHTAHSTLNRHGGSLNLLQNAFSIFAPIVSIIVIVIVIVVICRTKKLGQMIALLSLSKNTNARPLTEEHTDHYDYFDYIINLGTVILLLLWLIYIVLRYYKLLRRIYRTVSLPFRECITASEPPSCKIVLYLSSLNNYCYIHIDNILQYPENAVTHTDNTKITLTYTSTLCGSHVKLNNNDIIIIAKDTRFVLPEIIQIPLVLNHTVRTILACDYNVELLVGAGSHFCVLPLSTVNNPMAK